MTWIKLDDSFADHPKVGRLSDPSFRLHIAAMCYCGRFETDGKIPKNLPLLAGQKKRAAELVAAGLWEDVPDLYAIHDWLLYNPSRGELAQKREETALRVAKYRRTKRVTNAPPDPDPARPVVISKEIIGAGTDLNAYRKGFDAYEQATGFTLDISRQNSIMAVIDKHPVSWVVKAIAKSQAKGIAPRRLWAYAAAIIEGWEETGFDPDAERAEYEAPKTEAEREAEADYERALKGTVRR